MNEKIKTLAAKLCDIMSECKNIPKNGKNSFQNYKYVMAADAAEYIRELMVKHGVIALPVLEDVQQETFLTNKGATNYLVRVLVAYTLINAEDPKDTYVVKMSGTGSDTSDKAIFKAITGCQKYFIFNTFMLGGDDDPEKDDHRPQPQVQRQAPAPKAYQPSPTPRPADLIPPKASSKLWDGEEIVTSGKYKPDGGKKTAWKDVPYDYLVYVIDAPKATPETKAKAEKEVIRRDTIGQPNFEAINEEAEEEISSRPESLLFDDNNWK